MINIQEKIPLYSIFILILILSGGYVIQLIPCKLQRVLNTNIYIKHLFCFLTLIFLITLIDPMEQNQKLEKIIVKSIILYIFFIFLIKTHYKFFIAVIIILGIKYLILLKKNELFEKYKNETDKNKLKKIEDSLNNIIILQNILFYIVVLLIIIGFIIYLGEKKYEYKNNFNYLTFLFGKPNCKHTPNEISMFKSIKYAF
jgi:hypothetical protein